MAIRNIRIYGDEILRKKCRPVDNINNRITVLLDDMLETMYKADGVGLAGPQVGVLKRVVVIDVGEGPIYLVNPEIIESEGSQIGSEGCLSIPGRQGMVKRPARVKAKALDKEGKEIIIDGEGLLAVALCHEIDHLDGILFTDKIIESKEENNL